VTQDDLLYRFRLRTFAMAGELGNVRAACRAMGIHPSTYYRWKHQLDRHGPEILRPRERRTPRMANQTSVLVEQRVVAFALGHPGFGPARIAAELARPKWGRHHLVGQWDLAGARSPRPVDQSQTLWAGGWLRRPTRAPAAGAPT
jgi:Helix-turn-helix domain